MERRKRSIAFPHPPRDDRFNRQSESPKVWKMLKTQTDKRKKRVGSKLSPTKNAFFLRGNIIKRMSLPQENCSGSYSLSLLLKPNRSKYG